MDCDLKKNNRNSGNMWFMFDETNNGSSKCKMKKLLGHFMKHKPLIYKECLRFSTSCNSIVVGEKEEEKK